MSASSKDYFLIAKTYCEQILDGTIPAGKYNKLACQRHLDDLARTDWDFYFDHKEFSRLCKFVELCPHIKGKKFAGTTLKLEPWQVFVLTAFAWFRKSNNTRRFRRCYTEVAKGNGKSPLAAALCLYFAFVAREPGSEVYAAATSREQAKIVFDTARAMALKMPRVLERAGIEVEKHSLSQQSSNSFFRPLAFKANTVEGINPFFTCCDELHAHPSRDFYDNLDTANGKRESSVLWAITTAGDNRSAICYEVRGYLIKVLTGVIQDDSVFGCIWTIDDDDDPFAGEHVWRKANPNWGVCVDPQEIKDKAHAALQMVSKQPNFKTKHLNVWVNADHAWMDMVRWAKCADLDLDEKDFSGWRCVIGLDLASKLDLLAAVLVFWKDVDTDVTDPKTGESKTITKRHYYVFNTCWTPAARLDDTANSQYQAWVDEGWLRTCQGQTNSIDDVEDFIKECCRKYDVVEVAIDPWQAINISNRLIDEGITVVEVNQKTELSEPMKELEAAVYDGRLHYNGDPLLTWAVSNTVAHYDVQDNLMPTKERFENKIDPVSGTLTALNRVMGQVPQGGEISVFGNCMKCGQMAIGKPNDASGSSFTFLCPAHQEKK